MICSSSPAAAYQASQNLLNKHGNEIQGVFCPNESVAIGMMLALRDIGKAGGAIKLVGFDAGTQSVDGMKAGDVQGLVVQDPMKMGYLGVRVMIDHINGKTVDKRIDTGVVMVTQDNMEEAAIKALLYPPLDQYLK
ncbi:MAG: substrate-binding domain-containing protein [Verrucomicrobiota bacterium]